VQLSFILKFGFKTLKYHKKKYLFSVLGFTFALSLLLSNSIWQSTSQVIIIDKTLNNTDYLISTTSFQIGGTYDIENYLSNIEEIYNIDTLIHSNIIFNKGDKDNSYKYFPFNGQDNLTDPVFTTSAILLNLDGMSKISNLLDINGTFPSNHNEFMISNEIKSILEYLYNITIYPGYTIDLSIGQRYPATDSGEFELEYFQLLDFKNITISGIYTYNEASSVILKVLGTNALERSVIFPNENNNFNSDSIKLMDENTLFRNFLLEINTNLYYDNGIKNINLLNEEIANNIKLNIWNSITTIQSASLDDLSEDYQFRFNNKYLYYPLIFLAILLNHYAIGLLINDREKHFSILNLRGASTYDITVLTIGEIFIITVSALILTLPMSALFTFLIPIIGDLTNYDYILNLYLKSFFVNFSDIFNILVILLFTMLVSLTYFLIIFYNNKKQFLPDNFFNFIIMLFLIITNWITYEDYRRLAVIIDFNQIQYIPNISQTLEPQILVFIINWFATIYLISIIIMKSLTILAKIVNQKNKSFNFYFTKTYQRKRHNSLILTYFIILIFSILIFSNTYYVFYSNFDENSLDYLQGSDLRIQTGLEFSNYTNVIENITGVSKSTGVYQSLVYIGSLQFTVYAIDPVIFSEIVYWDFIENAEFYKNQLTTIFNNNKSNILVSDVLLNKFNLEINDELTIFGLGGKYRHNFNITGSIVSLPGLGLSNMQNPEYDQLTTGYLVMNINYLETYFYNSKVTTFLASIDDTNDYDKIINDIENLESVLRVNPNPINRNFVDLFVSQFLPKSSNILMFTIFSATIIGLLIIFLNVDYLINSRKQEFQLMLALGSSKQSISQFIIFEMLFLSNISMIVGYLLGYIVINFFNVYLIPLTIKRLFIPLDLNINILFLISSILIYNLVIVISIINNLKKLLSDKSISEIFR